MLEEIDYAIFESPLLDSQNRLVEYLEMFVGHRGAHPTIDRGAEIGRFASIKAYHRGGQRYPVDVWTRPDLSGIASIFLDLRCQVSRSSLIGPDSCVARRCQAALSCSRIEPPAGFRPSGLPSFPRCARLTPTARIPRSGPARFACVQPAHRDGRCLSSRLP